MTLTEKSAYLKGLLKGLNLDDSKPENKILFSVIELLNDITLEISELSKSHYELCDQTDAIDEDLATLEEDIYNEEDKDASIYEVKCPNCKETVCLCENELLEGKINCPNCDEELEFDFNDSDCNCGEECDCDNCNCHE